MAAPLIGGVEAGGTSWVCVTGTATGEITSRVEFPTESPERTLRRAYDVFDDAEVRAVGIATFGPVERRPQRDDVGSIRNTPKSGWSGINVRQAFLGLGVPVAVDTDVNAAGLAELTLGAAQGCDSLVYLTLGTGVGGGVIVNGAPVGSTVHPEIGHIAVVRRPGDTVPSVCPFHDDCLEGLASGPALQARFGAAPQALSEEAANEAAGVVAAYLVQGLRAVVLVVAPQRIVIGGGVSRLPNLIERLRQRFGSLMEAYPGLPEHSDPMFIVPAATGADAGARGALIIGGRTVAPVV